MSLKGEFELLHAPCQLQILGVTIHFWIKAISRVQTPRKAGSQCEKVFGLEEQTEPQKEAAEAPLAALHWLCWPAALPTAPGNPMLGPSTLRSGDPGSLRARSRFVKLVSLQHQKGFCSQEPPT